MLKISDYSRLVEFLKKKNLTIATAESCTGGLIAKLITDVAGSSDVFPGGIVSYSNEMKQKWLNVKEETLINMALSVKKLVVKCLMGSLKKQVQILVWQ